MEKLKLILIILGTFFVATTPKRIPSIAGEYRVVQNTVTNITSEYKSTGKIWVKLFCTQARGRQRQYVWGEVFLAINLTDLLKIQVRISKWSGNEWKKNHFVMNFNQACSSALNHAEDLLVMYFAEEGKKCPIKAGYRIVKNHSADVTFPQFPVFPYGRWLFTVAFQSGRETVGVVVSDVETVPRL